MRKLFLKIFGWFWGAMALVGAALFLAVTGTSPDPLPREWREEAAGALAVYAGSARDVLERDGPGALDVFLGRVGREARLRAWLLDDKGRILAGDPAVREPESAALVAARTLKSGQAEFEKAASGRGVVMALRVAATASGARAGTSGASEPRGGARHYVLVVASRLPRLGRQVVEPSAQALRAGVVFLTAGLVCYALVSYLTAPIFALRDATQRLAGGDLSSRVGGGTPARRDEMGDLSRDFNAMAERIEALVLSERRLAQGQRRLLGDISHELRSPLTRLSMALALVRRSTGDNTAARVPLDRIEREAGRLNALIGQLLELSRLENGLGDSAEAKESVDLQALVFDIAEDADFEARGQAKQVRVSASLPCHVTGSSELLRSAIENVVRNAVRHTAPNTAVEIELCPAPDDAAAGVVIRVRDRGEGVPNDALGDLFRPFYRVETARDRESGGVGLGLAITARAVQSHGGSVHAFNAPPNDPASDTPGGLVVEIRLPARVESAM
jgi:two-component system sensor histidine kinase CpxA